MRRSTSTRPGRAIESVWGEFLVSTGYRGESMSDGDSLNGGDSRVEDARFDTAKRVLVDRLGEVRRRANVWVRVLFLTYLVLAVVVVVVGVLAGLGLLQWVSMSAAILVAVGVVGRMRELVWRQGYLEVVTSLADRIPAEDLVAIAKEIFLGHGSVDSVLADSEE